MENNERHCVISNDFEIIDFEHGNVGRYEYTKSQLDPDEYDYSFSRKDWNEQHQSSNEDLSKEDQDACFLEDFNDWAESNLSYEELYEIPMMNALRYYPSFCSFNEKDRQAVDGNCTLLYDTERDQWAVGMTGGGMDLSPHLLDAFITLDSCVPEDIAMSCASQPTYSAYVNEEKHKANMQLVKKGLYDLAEKYKSYADGI